MARIAGVDLPKNKRIEIALTYIFGIGLTTSKRILNSAGVDPDRRVHQLTEDEISRLRKEIDANYKVEGELRSTIQNNIKRLIDIGCYRVHRHKVRLPLRGQRTRNNCRTHKGPRQSISTKKKK